MLGGAAPASGAPAAGAPVSMKNLWLEAPRVNGASVWFSDELTPIADAVAEALAQPANGAYRVIPNQELRAFWADVQKGKLPGSTQTCDAQPPPWRLARVVHADSLYGSINVRCDKATCLLEVDLAPPRDDQPTMALALPRFRADLPSSETPRQWAERIRQGGLHPAERVAHAGGVRAAIASANPRPGGTVALRSVVQSGSWAHPLASESFDPVAADLRKCEDANQSNPWRDWWEQPFIVAVNADGRATRCEYPHPDHLPRPDFACKCDVLRRMSFGKGAPDRRASFTLDASTAKARSASAFYRSASLGSPKADDPSAILGSGDVDDDALQRCLEPISTALQVKVSLRFRVGPDGRATEAKADWPQSLPSSATTCMDALLRKARFNCPLSGAASVTATLDVSVRAPARHP